MRVHPRIPAQVRKLRRKQIEKRPPVDGLRRRKKPSTAQKVQSVESAFKLLESWFAQKGWKPFSFQISCWRAYLQGRSGLLAVPTGSGKTMAAFGGPLIELLSRTENLEPHLFLLYISPLKALVRDVAQALELPIRELNLPFTVEVRTGDSSQADRARLRDQLPQILVTTPESLALLLAEKNSRARLACVRAVVLDEWHELLASKRGSLLELSLAKLRTLNPTLRTWALSATVGDLPLAAQTAVGSHTEPVLIEEKLKRSIAIHSILPDFLEPDTCTQPSRQVTKTFPWFGYSGLNLLDEVLTQLDPQLSTLLFTNTRSQAERWYQVIAEARPEWAEWLALHHGSLDSANRARVESGVKSGRLRIVVATSSLDLGVDFPQVSKVIQIGSTKGVARAIQRAGRAFHRPGEGTELYICPTHLLELVEISALRTGLKAGALESRKPLEQPLDVLVQFVLNSAFGEGFRKQELLTEIQSAYSFRYVTAKTLDWILRFVTRGGRSLEAYPQFHKLTALGPVSALQNESSAEKIDPVYTFASPQAARFHRFNMGTILSDSGVTVRFAKGQSLGQVDESFMAKLRPGDSFRFSGKTLQLIQLRDMTAFVRQSKIKNALAPIWNGYSFPISGVVSEFIRKEFDQFQNAGLNARGLSPELTAFLPAARMQSRISHLPKSTELLLEILESREGFHLFLYPFEGRSVHEGLGHLLAFRLSRLKPNTISVSANDHGLELLSTAPLGTEDEIRLALTSNQDLDSDITSSLNYNEMAKRAFREIARVAGLIQQGTPGHHKSARQLQISSSLLFDVFQKYEPGHPLLEQAFSEVKSQQLQMERLQNVMADLQSRQFVFRNIARLSPFSFPLHLERIKSLLSTESFETRIARLQKQLIAGPS